MKIITLIMVLMLSGCTVRYALFPKEAPEDADDPTFYLSEIKPELVTVVDWWLFRYMHWEGLEGFTSLIICPTGTPDHGTRKMCLQSYGGVKIDGTDAIIRQRRGDMRWGYVYKHHVDGEWTQNEQAAFRWHEVSGSQSVYNMGGQ